jgi:hypothetical protein
LFNAITTKGKGEKYIFHETLGLEALEMGEQVAPTPVGCCSSPPPCCPLCLLWAAPLFFCGRGEGRPPQPVLIGPAPGALLSSHWSEGGASALPGVGSDWRAAKLGIFGERRAERGAQIEAG